MLGVKKFHILVMILIVGQIISCVVLASPWQTTNTLPTYHAEARANGEVFNPFKSNTVGHSLKSQSILGRGSSLPPCPHMCILVGPGQTSSEAIRELEDQLGCSVAKAGMLLSDQGRKLLQSIETLRLKPYDDQTGKEINKWVKGATIGYGHLIKKRDWKLYKKGITKAQAEQIFKDDLAPFENAVNETITSPISQQQFDALVILTYNIGISNFENSSVAKLVNNPKVKTPYPDLEAAWKAWDKSQGNVNQGLINRRNSEWNIYTKGIYKRW
jgi:GH24 family phage-related lysozyme (muramidase)